MIAALLLAVIPVQPAPAHWAFVPPASPRVPAVADPHLHNPIDAFIRDRLRREGLTPSPQADRAMLLRRVTLDLTGLPPTLAEADAFRSDATPDAYEKVVARLLASPRFGERLASRWLDAARYADTCGYQNDGERFMWRWRDWVIEAINANMPFDQFTIEQLAGDLLPKATLDQHLATGFNRNHRGNGEGGIIPEEYAVEYVVDRVDTTATVWLGLTMGCARCHDHKYDPFKQRDYYQLFAFFNNVPEHGRAVKFGNSPPYLVTPTRDQQRQLSALDARIAPAAAKVQAMQPALEAAQRQWEQRWPAAPLHWSPSRSLQAALDHPKTGPAGDVGAFGFDDKFTLAARFTASDARGGTIIARMTDVPEGDGYAVRLVDGRVRAEFTKRWLDDALRVETRRKLKPGDRHHVAVVYDGTRLARGVTIFIDGQAEEKVVLLDELNQSFATKEPLRIGIGGGPTSRFHGAIDDVRVFRDILTGDEIAALADDRPIQSSSAIKRRLCFLATAAPQHLREPMGHLDQLQRERQKFVDSLPTTMVMAEMPTPRATYILRRGEYDKPGERVKPGLPVSLARGENRPPGSRSPNRLDLARWIASPENPLTARVAVNRLWQMFFGTGLVKTAEDFGTQGERPSHPELLDWLAIELTRSGWDVKALVRMIVTSATYRQTSSAPQAPRSSDPENRLLARGPRLRLSAEAIRDQALAASGLLVERLGGPSVRPYQPAGLGKELGAEEYAPSHGAELYRRSLYTFWKRTVAPPNMMAFDAAGREACAVREVRTNTPLQALTLLNDVTYVEAARKLAERAMREGGDSPASRITHAFRLVLTREPADVEIRVLLAGYRDHLAAYRREPLTATRLLRAGDAPIDTALDPADLAAHTAIASLILNLDEAVTKE